MIKELVRLWQWCTMPAWGAGNAHNVGSIRTYAEAEKRFNKTPKPRGARWSNDERPLVNTRSTHYLLRKEEGHYDAELYSTSMARFQHDGVVLLHGDSHEASYVFLSALGFSSWRMNLPFNPYVHENYTAPNGVVVPSGWSAVVVWEEGANRVCHDKSAHRPIFILRSSKEDCFKRAEFRAKYETIVELLTLRVPQFHAAAEVSRDRARAFGRRKGQSERVLQGQLSEERVEDKMLISFAQEVYNTALSKRENMLISRSLGLTQVDPMDPQKFHAALLRALMRLVGLDVRSKREELPQFAELPRRYFYQCEM